MEHMTLNPKRPETNWAAGPANRLLSGEPERVRILEGNPAASGAIDGPAVIVKNPGELPDLSEPAVLVCEAPTRELIALFPKTKALVAERGGLLALAVNCARERGIPVILGVREATTRIQDGDLVWVDGSDGQVVILD